MKRSFASAFSLLGLGAVLVFFFPAALVICGVLYLIAVGLLIWGIWPRQDYHISATEERENSTGDIASMKYTIKNAASGSPFSRNELSKVLREALLLRKANHGEFSESTVVGEFGVPLEDVLGSEIPGDLKEIFRTSKRPSRWRVLNIIRRRGAGDYVRKIWKALDYVEKSE